MKTQIPPFRKYAGALLCSVIFLLPSINSSFAITTTTIFGPETFASPTFPPTGWTTVGDGGWQYSNNGNGGVNGSAFVDLYDYYAIPNYLYTPTVDASAFTGATDSLFVDFDLWLERNSETDANGDDQFSVIASDNSGSTSLQTFTPSQDNTVVTNTFHASQPSTNPGDWRHYHIAIPAAYATSSLQIVFEGNPSAGGWTNPGIDNVSIIGKHYYFITSNPSSITFPNTIVNDSSVQQCVMIHNPNATPITLTPTLGGSNPNDFEITYNAGTVAPNSTDSVCVKFRPMNGGPRSAKLTIVNNSDNPNPIVVNLNGIAIAPIISISGLPIFHRSHTKLGQSSTQCFLVKNIGLGPLTLDTASKFTGSAPSAYRLASLPPPIQQGDSAQVCVIFSPNYEGTAPATLNLLSNANNGTQYIDVNGIGILPRLAIIPSNVNFDSVSIGDSICQTITLQNVGTDSLAITRNYFSSRDYDYTYYGLTGRDTLLAPDQSRTVEVCFKPVQNGTRNARIHFTTNIPHTFEQVQRDTSSFDVNVTGTGVPSGRLAIGGSTLDSAIIGQQVCQTDTIYNHGSNDLTITSATLRGSDSSIFNDSSLTLPMTIPAGGFAVVNICSRPGRRGLSTTSFVVTASNSGRTQTLTLPLATKGLLVCASTTPPGLFTNSQTLVGAMDSSTFTVTNCGDVPAKYTVSLPAGTDYSIVPLTSATIAPGDTARFTVVFLPTAIGPRNSTATVTAPNGIPAMTVTLGGTGTGVTVTATGEGDSVNLGDCKTFDVTITNTGNTSWTPGKGTITGPNSTDFTIASEATPATIAPNGTAIVKIQFCPKTTEGETANLTFDNAAPKPITPFQYTLTASGRNSEGVTAQTEQNGFRLEQNYPNPSQRTTDIQFSTPGTANVSLTLLDNQGKLIRTLLTGVVGQGSHTVKLNVSELPSGNYLYILQTPQARLVRQMAIVK